MESYSTVRETERMVSSFLEITVGQSAETARLFLDASGWQLEDAIQLFYMTNENGVSASSSLQAQDVPQPQYEDGVYAPLSVKREVLYGKATRYEDFVKESKQRDIWDSSQNAQYSVDEAPKTGLSSLFRPPSELINPGHFNKGKVDAALQGKWLIVNLQSTKEFSSHMLNRDTWANEAVAQTIRNNFIFWQVYDDTTEGRKVCTFYKLDSIPVVLVIDPITGQKMRSWNGMVEAERLLGDLVPFLDNGPKDQQYAALLCKRAGESSQSSRAYSQKILAADDTLEDENEEISEAGVALNIMEDKKYAIKSTRIDSNDIKHGKTEELKEVKKEAETSPSDNPIYPPLPEEPKGNINSFCRVCFRFPDGRRVQRNFLKTDPIQLLWSFCLSQLKEASEGRTFRLTEAIPGASKTIDYETKLTFEESGLSSSLLSLTWK